MKRFVTRGTRLHCYCFISIYYVIKDTLIIMVYFVYINISEWFPVKLLRDRLITFGIVHDGLYEILYVEFYEEGNIKS